MSVKSKAPYQMIRQGTAQETKNYLKEIEQAIEEGKLVETTTSTKYDTGETEYRIKVTQEL